MTRFIHNARRVIKDVRTFGPRFPLRHLSRLIGSKRQAIDIKGIGRIWIRNGSTDSEVLRQVFQDKEYELKSLKRYADIRARYEAILEAGQIPIIVDAGANVGIASLWFAHLFPNARVIAVEPEPANAAVCRDNIATNPFISLHEAAIGCQAGRISLNNPAGKEWSPRSERDGAGSIDVVTMDELIGTVPGGRLFLANIDIEGFESDLFSANVGWIDSAALLIIELHDWMLTGGSTSFAFQRAMGERRFEVVISGENLFYINTA